MADPYEYFCKSDTPQDLKDALFGGDQDRLRHWCKQNPDKLTLALECIHPHHTVYRDIVLMELSSRERAEAKATSHRRHRQNVWLTGIGVIGTIAAVIVAVVQCRLSEKPVNNPQEPTPAPSTASASPSPIMYNLNEPVVRRIVRTEVDFQIDGHIDKADNGQANEWVGSRFSGHARRVTDCELLEVTNGVPTKIRRTFPESSTNGTSITSEGKSYSSASFNVEHGLSITEELDQSTTGGESPHWSRRIDGKRSVCEQERRWVESVTFPDVVLDYYYPKPTRSIGENWTVGPRSLKGVRQWFQSNGAIFTPLDDPNLLGSAEVFSTFTLLNVEHIRGDACTLIHSSTEFSFGGTQTSSKITLKGRGTLSGRSYRSLSRSIELEASYTGSFVGEFYGLPIGGQRNDGKVFATIIMTSKQAVVNKP